MTEKERNCQTARLIAAAPFWRREYFPRYFTESFTMDFPSAPPGMPQHFDVWESERCFEWLNRTVKDWKVELEEFYTTPNPEQFWAIGQWDGAVFWGSRDGTYHSKFFMRLETQGPKINYIKFMIDPLGLLRAAGREVPVFHMDLFDGKVDEYLQSHPQPGKPPQGEMTGEEEYAGLDLSPEAVALRRKYNLETNLCGIRRETYRRLETTNPRFSGGAWFIPHEMDQVAHCRVPQRLDGLDFPEELAARGFAWTKASSPWMYRDTRSVLFPTDDESVWFAEMHGHGPGRWRGNGCDNGHYHQPYFLILKFDKAGRILVRDEVLNPINKYNCVNLTLPSFPYYL